KAERFYRRAAVLDPGLAVAAQGLAELLFAQGHDDEATAWAGRASAIQGGSVAERLAAWSLLAKLAAKGGQRPLVERAEAALIPLRAQATPALAAKYADTPAVSSALSK